MFKRTVLVLSMLLSSIVFAESQALDKIVAIVNEGVITEGELNKQVEIMAGQLQAAKAPVPDRITLRKQVLQHLINQDVQMQVAKNADLKIDDKELDSGLQRVADSNKITVDALKQIITTQGMDWKNYREMIRKEMVLAKLQQHAVGKNVPMVTDQQVQDYIKINGTNLDTSKNTYHLKNIVIPLADNPSAEQIKQAKNKAQQVLAKLAKGVDLDKVVVEESTNEFFLSSNDLGERHLPELPDIFARAVVTMKTGQVAGPLRTGNGFQLIKLIAVGGEGQQQHSVAKTHVRHILLKNDSSLTEAEAKRQVNNLYQQLLSGTDFAVMAKQHSVDPGSAAKGGDLGWVNAGETVPDFEKAMDKLSVNQISKPVKSPFGWHIIQVLGRKKADDTEAFKRQQVRNFLQQKKFAEAIQNWQQHLRGVAYVNILDKELA